MSLATSIPGINFPNPIFTTLFVSCHAYEHFLHVIDWVLALKQLSEYETETLNEIYSNIGWCNFCDTLTAIAIHQLGLPQEWFAKTEQIAVEQEQRL